MANQDKKTILSVVGTRPNFMKVGPIEDHLSKDERIRHLILHTGQHYDHTMSKAFFDDLNLRTPDVWLGIHGGRLGDQTGRIMVAFEEELRKIQPDLVLVVGDVNSTFAAAWVAAQNHIPVAHVEAGLRSFDRRMPEEINRICTDVICDLLFTTHPTASDQLVKEGINESKIFMVGDIMIDYLIQHRNAAQRLEQWKRFDVKEGQYAVLTLHRPSNVDDPDQLQHLVETLIQIAQELPILFPVHPRTRKNLEAFGLFKRLSCTSNIKLSEPLGYLAFLSLVLKSRLVLTDSGGLQEETSFLNIPCMTLRENTERPFCLTEGTNHLAGTQGEKILTTFRKIMQGSVAPSKSMEGWDGNTGRRVADTLIQFLFRE